MSGKVDTEAQPELATAFGISSIPTLMVIRDNVVLYAQPGALPTRALDLLITKTLEMDMDEVSAPRNCRIVTGCVMRPGTAGGASSARRHRYVRTSCGRQLTADRLALGDTVHPAGGVFVDLGECPDGDGSSWAGLTTAEARKLSWALLSQAAAAERDCLAVPSPARRRRDVSARPR